MRHLALQLGVAAAAFGDVFLPSLGRQVADGVQEEITGFLEVEWHGDPVLYLAVRIRRPIRPERKGIIRPGLGSLYRKQAPSASLRPTEAEGKKGFDERLS